MLFCVCCGFLFDKPAIVFQRMCVFVLWSQFSSKCCFHMFSLCFCMLLSMSVFSVLMYGFVGFCCLSWFLSFILLMMSCGSGFRFFWCFPWGMLCLSAANIEFVIIL